MSASERLLDAVVRHNIGLWRLVRGLERESAKRHTSHVSRIVKAGASSLDALLDLGRRFWPSEGRALDRERQRVARYEADFLRRAIDSAIPAAAGIQASAVDRDSLRAAVNDHRWRGQSPAEVFEGLRLREGAALGTIIRESPEEFRPEVLRQLRRQRAWVAAQWGQFTTAAAAEARAHLEVANDNILQGVVWLSVIDTRTTAHICLPRHMKRYSIPDYQPIGHDYEWGPGPGRIHIRCRSLSSPVFHGADVLRMDDTPGLQAAFNGEYPEELNGEQLLRRQPARELDQLFGPTRSRLFREGGLSLEDLIRQDRSGLVNLDQLRRSEAGAFDRAGV